MNITAELIKSILTQSEAITCKNIRIEPECQEDIIIRFEDDTDTTVSIYYTPVNDILAVGTMNSQGDYRNFERFRHASRSDRDTFCKYLALVVATLEIQLELTHDMKEE